MQITTLEYYDWEIKLLETKVKLMGNEKFFALGSKFLRVNVIPELLDYGYVNIRFIDNYKK
jgi:hypothetical protein